MENWKSLYIYFISGTGNAKASSEWIADEEDMFWFTSLTALPFWKRYVPGKKNKTLNNSV
jgi:hypothetical protein